MAKSSEVVSPDVMGVKELAEYMQVSRGWVYQNKLQIPHRRVGNLYFFSKKAVDEWLATDREFAGEQTIERISDAERRAKVAARTEEIGGVVLS
jgi:excisionase family DNA binding protein